MPTFAFGLGVEHNLRRLVDVEVAWKESLAEARLVAATFDPCDPIFLRYFDKGHAQFVQDMFRTIANIDLSADLSGNNVEQYLPPRKWQINTDFQNLKIYYGTAPEMPPEFRSTMSCSSPSDPPGTGPFATLFQRLDGTAYLSVCEQAFQYPRLATILDPPPELRLHNDPAGASLYGYTCLGLGDRDTDLMVSPAGILLHEYIHWTFLFRHVPRFNSYIRDGIITDYAGPDPPHGYGPYYAARLRALSLVEKPGDYRDNEVLQNADNYASYAHSKYWSFICGKTFAAARDLRDATQRIPIPARIESGRIPPPE